MVIKEGKFGRSKLTSVWLNIDDYNFCRDHHLTFAQIFRDKIRELRGKLDGEKTDSQKIQDLIKTVQSYAKFLEDKGLLDVYATETKVFKEPNEDNLHS